MIRTTWGPDYRSEKAYNMPDNIKRILVYTHNSIGLGHAFRTLAVITSIKRWRPDINFLVITSTSIPQIFFEEGIEVVKLPSVKLDIDRLNDPMIPRYLTDFDVESIFEFRQRIILETFDFFKPDVLMVEHNMTGQMSEAKISQTRRTRGFCTRSHMSGHHEMGTVVTDSVPKSSTQVRINQFGTTL